jgi:colicin import membrane protein
MDVAAERPEFEPPPPPGRWSGFMLALLAHALLLVALTWGLRWQREAEDVAAEAELWSSVPRQAAPKEVAPVPPPPKPEPKPQPKPEPVQKVEPPPEPKKAREPDINVEKQKKLEAQKRAREEEARKEEAERRQEARKERERLEAEKRERLEAQKREREQQQRVAEEKRRKLEEEQKRKEKLQQERLAKLHDETVKRLQGMAGGTSSDNAPSTAARSSGPSSSWAGRVRARVKPNIVFTDVVAGNPKAEVEVRLAPDGTIVGKRLVKSSGVPGWDDAVLRALDKTEVLPRDTDGRVPSPVILEFRPKD